MRLIKEHYKKYVEKFNDCDDETVIQLIDNKSAWSWMEENIPFFECPDKEIEETYYFRWWVYRKHIKKTEDGFIITEFHPNVPWAGKHNSINCASGFHFSEGRWLANGSDYLKDYALFWYRKGGSNHSYSTWLVHAIYEYCLVKNDFVLAVELLPDMIMNYYEWEKSNQTECGLFWSIDDRDAMECSISGNGLRPTLNSYMFADAMAISKIAKIAGNTDVKTEFYNKAKQIKFLVEDKLWDEASQFFKTLPLKSKEDKNCRLNFNEIDTQNNVREEIGFIPWYFNLPGQGFEAAWKELMDHEGFYAPYGPTTAEQRHPRFMYRFDEHECLWNGPSWPFATSQTLSGMANLLNNYEQEYVNKKDYFDLLKIYSKCHYREKNDGSMVSWIDENIDPFTGRWLSRDILEKWNWRNDKGGVERGKDYNHSIFCDLIITGLLGLRIVEGNHLVINPLLPDNMWEYFCLDDINYKGKNITILYDKYGERYSVSKGLHIYVDQKEVGYSLNLDKVVIIIDTALI